MRTPFISSPDIFCALCLRCITRIFLVSSSIRGKLCMLDIPLVGYIQRINTSVSWQSDVGRRGFPAMVPHVAENVRASNLVPSCLPSIATPSYFLCSYHVSTDLYVRPCMLSNAAGCYSFIWWHFMKPTCSWPYSQEPVTGPCFETWIQSTTPYPLFATNINVSLPYTFWSCKCFSDQRFLNPPLRAACSVSYPSWFYHPIDMYWRVQMIKFLLIHVGPSSFSFLLTLKY
jgi:hypothetical protein